MKKLNTAPGPVISALDQGILKQARKLEQWTMLLRNELPPECDGHYHVASFHDNTLVIVTDSPVWTTRLRQLGPLIIQTLKNKVLLNLQHVRIISRHGPTVSNYDPPVVKHELSPQASRQIEQTAAYIQDKPLKDALLKIARHGRKK